MNEQHHNNLNLIRLLAAIQVALVHAITYLSLDEYRFFYLLSEALLPFSGVPVFFTISGFLVFNSYKARKEQPFSYWQSRVLRLFPALIVCSALTLLLLLWKGYAFDVLCLWFLGQITIFQSYTPEALLSWGNGVPNGSLWTIGIEIQFYLCIPLIYFGLHRLNKFIFLSVLFIASYFFFCWINTLDQQSWWATILDAALFPYLFFFLFGIALAAYWNFCYPIIQKQAYKFFVLYIVYYIVCYSLTLSKISYNTDASELLRYSLLVLSIFSFAYSFSGLSQKLIGSVDLSYGIYLYHMPLLNFINEYAISKMEKMIYWSLLTFICACFSWFMIEKKAAKLKNTT